MFFYLTYLLIPIKKCYKTTIMTKKEEEILFDLLATPSPTGFEEAGQRKWLQYASQFADHQNNDAYGSSWVTLDGKGNSPKTVMIEAHADEIGYMVKHITDDGFIRIDVIGGSDAATGRGRKLDIFGDKGVVKGLIGNTAIHIRDRTGGEKAPTIDQLYVDIGAKNKKEVASAGIRIGHPAVYSDSAEKIGKNRLAGRALDNRIGGFVIAQVMKNLNATKSRPNFTVHAVNSVQEEIGCIGAKMVAHRLQPDIALVLDVTHATDTPGIDHAKHGDVKLGEGPTVTHGACNHPKVVERLEAVAKKSKIKIQHEASSRYSGTDTDSIYHSRNGIPSALISLPTRYMHSIVEMIDLKDLDLTIKIMTDFVKSLKPKEDFGHRFF